MTMPRFSWWVVIRAACVMYSVMVLVGIAVMWWRRGTTFYGALDLLPPFIVFVFSVAVYAAVDHAAHTGTLYSEVVQVGVLPPMLRPAQRNEGRVRHSPPFVRAIVQDAAGWRIVELPEDWRMFDLADCIAWSLVLSANGGLGSPICSARQESLCAVEGYDLARHSTHRASGTGVVRSSAE